MNQIKRWYLNAVLAMTMVVGFGLCSAQTKSAIFSMEELMGAWAMCQDNYDASFVEQHSLKDSIRLFRNIDCDSNKLHKAWFHFDIDSILNIGYNPYEEPDSTSHMLYGVYIKEVSQNIKWYISKNKLVIHNDEAFAYNIIFIDKKKLILLREE